MYASMPTEYTWKGELLKAQYEWHIKYANALMQSLEDVIEDEGGSGINDSAFNPGVIEQKNVSDSITDTVSHEQEVAQVWDERYKKMLNHK